MHARHLARANSIDEQLKRRYRRSCEVTCLFGKTHDSACEEQLAEAV